VDDQVIGFGVGASEEWLAPLLGAVRRYVEKDITPRPAAL